MEDAKPLLVEPGMRYFLGKSLQNCRVFKDQHICFFFNVGMMGVFVIIVSSILLFKYKGKLTPHEKETKNIKKHEYIISKLQQLSTYKRQQRRASGDLITDLPSWNDHPEAVLLNKQRSNLAGNLNI
jgi:hypothetical protein